MDWQHKAEIETALMPCTTRFAALHSLVNRDRWYSDTLQAVSDAENTHALQSQGSLRAWSMLLWLDLLGVPRSCLLR